MLPFHTVCLLFLSKEQLQARNREMREEISRLREEIRKDKRNRAGKVGGNGSRRAFPGSQKTRKKKRR
jgi:hypothetical protein